MIPVTQIAGFSRDPQDHACRKKLKDATLPQPAPANYGGAV
jgi:hypothetical protein